MTGDPMEITPFRIDVPQSELDDLRRRLRATRWPEPETVEGWGQGMPLKVLQDMTSYWAEDYDWRDREARMNAIPAFRTEIDGLTFHFQHVRSPHADALPLILTHGWPGSVVEFAKVIGPLTDPTGHGGQASDAFHVVCPSLPGYGFSDRPSAPGWGLNRTASAWSVLMARLGYDRYVAQGGDWGSFVTSCLPAADPEHLIGIHLNMAVVAPDPSVELTESERKDQGAAAAYHRSGGGYASIQSSRPQTMGYGLVDSPSALAGWILEKFWFWTDHGDRPVESVLSRDEQLDNVMLYWLSRTGASAARLYWETGRGLTLKPIQIPVGVSIFPRELFRTSERFARRHYPGLSYFNEVERGGHFAAFEQPELFVDEVRACFRPLR
jgi:pimeloyl-ACP methyl ester carboxylesterase